MSTKRLFLYIFFAALFAMAVRPINDPDMWWHLRTGGLILENGLPYADPFSFTKAGVVWITHEWLSEIIMWLIYSWGGFAGLIAVFAGITVATYALLYPRCYGRPFWAVFILLLSAVSSAIVWDVRPQMFNLLFAAFFIYILEGERFKQLGQRHLYWLIPATVLWVNLHSGYLLGIVIVGIYFVGALIPDMAAQKSFIPRGSERSIHLFVVMIVAFFAAALNPNGTELWLYPFYTLGSGAMQVYIQEWHSPNFQLPHFQPFLLMLALGGYSWMYGRKQPEWTDLLLFFGSGLMGLVSARNIPIFAVVCAPLLSRYSLALWEGTAVYPLLSGEQTTPPVPTMMSWINRAALAVVCLGVVGWAGQQMLINDEVTALRYPVAAVDYLEAHALAETDGFNDYNWGGYLIWRGVPVFVDGRADVYGDAFLHQYRNTYDMDQDWSTLLDSYEVAYILMPAQSPLWTLLGEQGGWHEAYADETAAIWVRNE